MSKSKNNKIKWENFILSICKKESQKQWSKRKIKDIKSGNNVRRKPKSNK